MKTKYLWLAFLPAMLVATAWGADTLSTAKAATAKPTAQSSVKSKITAAPHWNWTEPSSVPKHPDQIVRLGRLSSHSWTSSTRWNNGLYAVGPAEADPHMEGLALYQWGRQSLP